MVQIVPRIEAFLAVICKQYLFCDQKFELKIVKSG